MQVRGSKAGVARVRSARRMPVVVALVVAVACALFAAGARSAGDDFGGSSDADIWVGSPENDAASGAEGHDYLRGLGGSDELSGGPDGDTLIGDEGSAGADVLAGDGGADELAGGDGNDTISGGAGGDLIGSLDFSDAGGPVVVEAGNDAISGGAGNDVVNAGPGDDTAQGDAGNDVLRGGAGNDHLEGGAGDDTLLGGEGEDLLRGGPGEDVLDGGPGADTIDCDASDVIAPDPADRLTEACRTALNPPSESLLDGTVLRKAKAGGGGERTRMNVRVKITGGAASGTLRVEATEKLKRKRYAYAPTGVDLTPGTTKRLTLKPPRNLARKLNAKLDRLAKRKRRGTAKLRRSISITLVDAAAGERRTEKRTVMVKASRKGKRKSSGPRQNLRGHLSTPCRDFWISNRVRSVTGNEALGGVCNARLYNNGSWDSEPELGSYVSSVMNRCGSSADLRNLVQAVTTITGQPPKPGTAACAKATYEAGLDYGCTSGCSDINWGVYLGEEDGGPAGANPGYLKSSVYMAVHKTLHICSSSDITQAVIEATDNLPDTRAGYWSSQISSGSQTQGQCHRGLYNSGQIYSYEHLAGEVARRVNSTATCANATISNAFLDVTGWRPVASTPTGGECNPDRYGGVGGSWANAIELRSRVAASFRCRDPWIGQVYAFHHNTFPRGYGNSGECNVDLYGNGSWSDYADLRRKVATTRGALEINGVEFRGSGSIRVSPPGTGSVFTYEPNASLVANAAGRITTTGGNLLSDKGLGLIGDHGSGLISLADGSKLAVGGGSLIGGAGGNLIGGAGGNLIGGAGGNILAAGS